MPGQEEQITIENAEEILERANKTNVEIKEFAEKINRLEVGILRHKMLTAEVYKEALEEILSLEPGLWKSMQRIAAKALGVEYVEDA